MFRNKPTSSERRAQLDDATARSQERMQYLDELPVKLNNRGRPEPRLSIEDQTNIVRRLRTAVSSYDSLSQHANPGNEGMIRRRDLVIKINALSRSIPQDPEDNTRAHLLDFAKLIAHIYDFYNKEYVKINGRLLGDSRLVRILSATLDEISHDFDPLNLLVKINPINARYQELKRTYNERIEENKELLRRAPEFRHLSVEQYNLLENRTPRFRVMGEQELDESTNDSTYKNAIKESERALKENEQGWITARKEIVDRALEILCHPHSSDIKNSVEVESKISLRY